MAKRNLDQTNPGGWVAMQQLYFLSAWIPNDQKQTNQFYSKADVGQQLYLIGFTGPLLSIKPGEQLTTGATLYNGPELPKKTREISTGLGSHGRLWLAMVGV